MKWATAQVPILAEMKLNRNKIIGVLGVWVFSFVLNSLGFGLSTSEASVQANQLSGNVVTQGTTQPVILLASPVENRTITTVGAQCMPSGNSSALWQGSTSEFLFMPRDCFKLSLGKVETQPMLMVFDGVRQYSLGMQQHPKENLSVPVSLQDAPVMHMEFVLPTTNNTSQKTAVAMVLTLLVLVSMLGAIEGNFGRRSQAYLQVFRC